jgi:general secretion pathway protein K
MLNVLLEELGFDFGESRELSSALLDWIDEDDSRRLNGAESEDYLDRDPPYRAANGPLQTLEELRLVEGWNKAFFGPGGRPNELFAELASMVSVRHGGKVNLNAAPPRVIALLAERDGWAGDYLFDGLDQPYLEEAPAAADTSLSGTETSLIGVTVTVRRGRAPFVVDALVAPAFGGEGAPAAAEGGGGRPGRGETTVRTGSAEEQDALAYPFRILALSEYERPRESPRPARYSAVDIDAER